MRDGAEVLYIDKLPGSRGLEMRSRIGLHTGECELLGDNLSGLAVHIGARIAAEARSGAVTSAAAALLLATAGWEMTRLPIAARAPAMPHSEK